jgi:ribonuclease P protein subunit Rpp14 (EC 3.1.26.5)
VRHLPKHARPRWRYLAVTVATRGGRVDRDGFQRAVWYAGQNLLGDPGGADADLSVVRFRFGDGHGAAVIRVRRGEVTSGRAAVACVDRVEGTPVGVAVRGVSGTIRACEESYLPAAGGVSSERETRSSGSRASCPVDVQTAGGHVGATEAEISDGVSESTANPDAD